MPRSASATATSRRCSPPRIPGSAYVSETWLGRRIPSTSSSGHAIFLGSPSQATARRTVVSRSQRMWCLCGLAKLSHLRERKSCLISPRPTNEPSSNFPAEPVAWSWSRRCRLLIRLALAWMLKIATPTSSNTPPPFVGLAASANYRLSISPQPCLAKRRRTTVSRFRGAANGLPQKPSPHNLG